jgi:hypothetical protein
MGRNGGKIRNRGRVIEIERNEKRAMRREGGKGGRDGGERKRRKKMASMVYTDCDNIN